jgi:hypothetical protein
MQDGGAVGRKVNRKAVGLRVLAVAILVRGTGKSGFSRGVSSFVTKDGVSQPAPNSVAAQAPIPSSRDTEPQSSQRPIK